MQGKVKEIRRTAGSQKPDLVFNYDGLGNRVSKTVIPKNSLNNEDSITTYYVRDAQGNILATYERTKYKNGDEKFYLKEQYFYGSSRIGMKVSNQLLASNVNGSVEIKEYDGYFTKIVGNKRYELTNHLGNVLAVVSDKKGADNEPDVISVTDYFPFGMQMPGRSFNANSYRHGYNTQEKTDEVAGTGNHYTAQYWEYNPQVVQRWNLDPKPNPSMSFYATFAGNPILFTDFHGDSINIAQEHREQFGKDIKSVFGDKASSFSFNENGNLLLNETTKDFTKEMSKEQKKAFEGLNEAMIDKQTTSMVYADKHDLTINGETKSVDIIKEYGGGVYFKTDNKIVIAPNVGTVNVTLDIFPFPNQDVKQNTTSTLFHEIGERNTISTDYRGVVIDYENHVRKIIGLLARPYDLNHSKTVKTIYK